MYEDVKDMISRCKLCTTTNPENRKKAKFGRRKLPSAPLEFVAIDFIVDLPITKRNNIHILTIVDGFSKFVRLYALKDRTATTAAKFIYDYCMTFGIPKILYSDKDPAYRSDLFSQLMKLLGVRKLSTTGYNPRANGQCEKSNGIVKNMLLKYVNSFGKQWDEWLREITYAYNTSIHTSTGFSPAEVMFGRKFRIPLDILYGYDTGDKDLHYSIEEFKCKLSRIYDLLREQMNFSKRKRYVTMTTRL